MPRNKKRKSGRRGGRPFKEKPRMCDPGMCDHCQYMGEGDFICDNNAGASDGMLALVVVDWEPTEYYKRCRRRSRE